MDELMEMGGDAVAAIIAAGCGYPGDEKAEAVASKLGIDAQADLLGAMYGSRCRQALALSSTS